MEANGRAGDKLKIMKCHNSTLTQRFLYNNKMEIVASKYCLDAIGINAPVTLHRCHGLKGNQQWQYNSMVNYHQQTFYILLISFFFFFF